MNGDGSGLTQGTNLNITMEFCLYDGSLPQHLDTLQAILYSENN